MLVLIFMLIIAAVALIVIGVKAMPQVSGVKSALPRETAKSKSSGISFLAAIFPFTNIILDKLNLETRIKNRITSAQLRITPQEFINLKLLFILALVILAPILVGNRQPLVFVIAFAFGYMLPDIWLSKRISRHKNAISKVLPETIDLLSLCVDAGLDFVASIEWLMKKGVSTNPMIGELVFVLEEIQWGKSRSAALKDMAKRLNIPEVNSFIQTLIQAERMGAPVAEAFALLSEDARAQRFHRGERFAMKAPIKILIPLIFCILPVIAIVIGGPILLQFTQGKMIPGF